MLFMKSPVLLANESRSFLLQATLIFYFKRDEIPFSLVTYSHRNEFYVLADFYDGIPMSLFILSNKVPFPCEIC